jgi:hypothetical protein
MLRMSNKYVMNRRVCLYSWQCSLIQSSFKLLYICSESYFLLKTQNMGKEREKSYRKMKRFPGERHIQTWFISAITHDFMWTSGNGAAIITCSHTFTFFWSKKSSVFAKIYQVSMYLYLCVTFIWRSLHFLVRVFHSCVICNSVLSFPFY